MNNGKKPTSRSYQSYLIESLQNLAEAAAYIEAVLEDGDSELLQSALEDVAQAQRQSIAQRSLPDHTISKIDELVRILNTLGLELKVAVKSE